MSSMRDFMHRLVKDPEFAAIIRDALHATDFAAAEAGAEKLADIAKASGLDVSLEDIELGLAALQAAGAPKPCDNVVETTSHVPSMEVGGQAPGMI